ncbi:MAG: hypothetical protein ACKVTZ_13510 [Bacteroidia bacterium]
MYSLTFTLKQHTPLIHFQHEQAGATLRASEVKPKLDRFILAHCETTIAKICQDAFEKEKEQYKSSLEFLATCEASFANEWGDLVEDAKNDGYFDEHLERTWKNIIFSRFSQEKYRQFEEKTKESFFVGDTQALDYKMRIEINPEDLEPHYLFDSFFSKAKVSLLEREGYQVLPKAPYFADSKVIGDREYDKAKQGLMLAEGRFAKVEIFSFNTILLEIVKDAFPKLLALENFGTRQSKGFGGFTVHNIVGEKYNMTKDKYEEYLKIKHGGRVLYYTFNETGTDLTDVFKEITERYQILKSGFLKESSVLATYYKSRKKIEWEKTLVKAVLIDARGAAKGNDYSTDDKNKYIRAFLGFAELYEYPRKEDGQSKVKVRHLVKDENGKIDLGENGTFSEGEIKRFRSPITIKVFYDMKSKKYTIYLLIGEVPEKMYDKTFQLSREKDEYILINTPKDKVDLMDIVKLRGYKVL